MSSIFTSGLSDANHSNTSGSNNPGSESRTTFFKWQYDQQPQRTPSNQKFSLEELINCCYILDGINEQDFVNFLLLANTQVKNTDTSTSGNNNTNSPLKYQKLISNYLSNNNNVCNLLSLKVVKDILVSKNICNNFNDFQLSISPTTTTKNDKYEDPEDPLAPEDPLSITNDNDISVNSNSNENSNKPTDSTSILQWEAQNLIVISKEFKNFVQKYKCEENLQFLIDIYNYEQIWNICFKNKRFSILKCKITNDNVMNNNINGNNESDENNNETQNNHQSFSVQRTTTNNKQTSPRLASSLSRQNSTANKISNLVSSFQSIRGSFDVSSFVDESLTTEKHTHNTNDMSKELSSEWDTEFNKQHQRQQEESQQRHLKQSLSGEVPNNNTKDSLSSSFNVKFSHVNNSESATTEAAAVQESAYLSEQILTELKKLLNEKWDNIIYSYVNDDSPFQINLPDDVFNKIQAEDSNSHVLYHSPITLLHAKNSVVQLLKENIYHPFLKQLNQRQHQLKLSSPVPTFPTASPSTTGNNITHPQTMSSKDFTSIATSYRPLSGIAKIRDSVSTNKKSSVSSMFSSPRRSTNSKTNSMLWLSRAENSFDSEYGIALPNSVYETNGNQNQFIIKSISENGRLSPDIESLLELHRHSQKPVKLDCPYQEAVAAAAAAAASASALTQLQSSPNFYQERTHRSISVANATNAASAASKSRSQNHGTILKSETTATCAANTATDMASSTASSSSFQIANNCNVSYGARAIISSGSVTHKGPCGVVATESSYTPSSPPLNKRRAGWLKLKKMIKQQR